MILNVKNENYGYSVATHNDWVAVGNPSLFRYNSLTSSLLRTGSVDIFKYNTLTDQHDLLLTIYKPVGTGDDLFLARDDDSYEIHTDKLRGIVVGIGSPTGVGTTYAYSSVRGGTTTYFDDFAIQLDGESYVQNLEDDYGHSVDIFNNMLIVGNRWYNQNVTFDAFSYNLSGSTVEIYNLTLLNSTPFDGFISTGSGFLSQVLTPPSGDIVSGSFGHSVSINNEWIAVGSPEYNSTCGGVHLYRRNNGGDPHNIQYTYHSTITGSSVGDYFGYSVDLNRKGGNYSMSMAIGCGNKIYSGNKVYFLEFTNSVWGVTHTFESDRTLYKLPFYDVNPIPRCEDYAIDGFGNNVSLYGNDLIISAPTDRWIYEYSGSSAYKQGACYFFYRCPNYPSRWILLKKFYGNTETFKNNKLGFSTDVYEDYLVVSCPKSNLETMSPCYIAGSIWQQHYCYANLENYLQGQWILFQKNTSSVDNPSWDIVNVYQKKKKYLTPFRSYGYDVAIGDKSIIIGSPMIISGSNRVFSISNTGSIINDVVLDLDDVSGKSYIYNMKNLRDEFHVGNVFYRNGKIVLNTSGSIFDGLWFEPINEYEYEYEIHFKSKQTLFEKQIACVVEPGEFNVSTNPTAIYRESCSLDINKNGYFDWQDMEYTLRYMQYLNTRYDKNPTTDWSSSILTEDDEISYYNFNSTLNYQYVYGNENVSQSLYSILDSVGIDYFDFNQDSKIDLNDINIFWKYCSNRLTPTNFQHYITPNSQRKSYSDIVDHLNDVTKKKTPYQIKSEFVTFNSQSMSDKTGSYLAPYITTVGLYSGLDLVAVAKLATPIKNTGEYPLNFLIKIDF